MKWKDTEKGCWFFNSNTLTYYKNRGKYVDPFNDRYQYQIESGGFLYPKQDLTNVSSLRVTSLNPESTLYFDTSSQFPRFKLGLTDHKRCIKITKANYVVVSGAKNIRVTDEPYVVIEEEAGYYFVLQSEWNMWFGGRFDKFVSELKGYHDFTSNAKIIYNGKIQSYAPDSLYWAKYANGEYTVPFITDNDLDKVCCNMCPEPTYDEFLSIIDMLNSDDAAVVQLGVKMLAGYNVAKYKLSFRMILCSRRNWYDWSRNLVACKQLVETLGINNYMIYDGFSNACNRIDRGGETYDPQDVEIAKKLAAKFIKEEVQKYVNDTYFNKGTKWLPDERKVTFE